MPEEKKSRLWLWILVGATAFFVLLLSVFALVGLAMRGSHGGEFAGFGDKIGVIDVEGVILDPRTVVKQLREFRRDDSIRAIILHVNTPGGGAAAKYPPWARSQAGWALARRLAAASNPAPATLQK